MTLTIELTPEEARRVEIAKAQGVDVSALVRGILSSLPDEPTVGAQIVAKWALAGVIGSRPDITDSVEHARKLREHAQNTFQI